METTYFVKKGKAEKHQNIWARKLYAKDFMAGGTVLVGKD